MLRMRTVVYNISLLWSSGLWVTFPVYKHSAPAELSRLGCGPKTVLCCRCFFPKLLLLRWHLFQLLSDGF